MNQQQHQFQGQPGMALQFSSVVPPPPAPTLSRVSNSGGQSQRNDMHVTNAPGQAQSIQSMHVSNSQTQITDVKKRSCDECTQIKVKCSGGEPCKRCAKKGLTCVYSLAKKRGPPKGKKRVVTPVKRPRAAVEPPAPTSTKFNPEISFEHVRQLVHQFADERDWHQFHTPRNLLLAMVGEVGELSELFQWKEDVKPGLPGFTSKEKEAVSDELADVLIYLTRLSDRCGIDLATAAINKISKNAAKYPTDKSKGNAKKYTEFSYNKPTGALPPAEI